jgi:hypothetical protein
VVHDLRGGMNSKEAAWLLITIWMLQQQSAGFQTLRQAPPPPHHQLFGGTSSSQRKNSFSKSNQSGASLQMERPSSMPHQDFTALTKQQRRNLPDPKGQDYFIQIEGYPRLELRFNQVKYKTPKHGPDHGLPKDSNGKTPKTEANTIALRDSLLNMPNSQDIVWYTDGQYQEGTSRGCDCVNLFDPDRNLIAVYQKQSDGSNLFLTTCRLTPLEVKHLKETNGNFLPKRMIKQQSGVRRNIQDPRNTNNDLQ